MMRYLIVLTLTLLGVGVWLVPNPEESSRERFERDPNPRELLASVEDEAHWVRMKLDLMETEQEIARRAVEMHRASRVPHSPFPHMLSVERGFAPYG